MARQYRGQGMVIAAAGATENLNSLCEAHFTSLPPGSIPPSPPARWDGTPKIHPRDLEQAHLTLGFQGLPHHHPDIFTQALFTSILGTGMSSRLFQEVREKRGLCYSVFSFSWSFADTGLVGVYAATSPRALRECLHTLCGELRRMTQDVTEDELQRARAQTKAALLMGLESSSIQAARLARDQLLHGRVRPLRELLTHIEAVSTEDIHRFATDLLTSHPQPWPRWGPLKPSRLTTKRSVCYREPRRSHRCGVAPRPRHGSNPKRTPTTPTDRSRHSGHGGDSVRALGGSLFG